MSFKLLYAFLLAVMMTITNTVLALDSDRNQPAVIDADEVDIDLETGERIYRKNVYMQQGTIRVKADEVVTMIKNGKLQNAVAVGRPAIFRQRPEGKETDVIAKGSKMEIDEVADIVTLFGNPAVVEQEGNVITGKTIVYNMSTSKVKIRGGGSQSPTPPQQDDQTAEQSDGTQAEPSTESDTAGGTTDATTSDSGRARMTIPPRKKQESSN
ncbi:MAG: lipopolysaccharide transport periplasmic protein LptA [Gammaproteobacteria bacterium]|nr:lipopolysaccharide transport periplasmic protein LptA [Gammaproteobacteria bacterium]